MPLQVTVQRHALDQCEVLVAGRRVAYICYGEDAKLNWLSTRYLKESGDPLTIEEKIAIAEFAKSTAKKLTVQREERRAEISAAIGDEALPLDFFAHDPVESTISTQTQKSPANKDK